jgi:hypothetical protein
MKKWFQGMGAVFLLGGSLLMFSGCVGADYEGGGVAYYDYDYYPDWDIYYYPRGHVYYWNDEGHWHSGGRLPERYELREHHSEQLHLRSQQPWTEHHAEHPGEAPHHQHEHDHDRD